MAVSERIFKIGQHLANVAGKNRVVLFFRTRYIKLFILFCDGTTKRCNKNNMGYRWRRLGYKKKSLKIF